MHQHDRIQHHFNSHPHKEDDGLCASVWFCMLISTHILTKRMTYFPLFCFALNPISTHILTKRMTTHDRLSVPHQSHFNSHPHEEDDYLFAHLLVLHHHFNSHPHEEDDCIRLCFHIVELYFNSHPHEEDDVLAQSGLTAKEHFNSHPHEEDDCERSDYYDKRRYFNSHPHEEDDKYWNYVMGSQFVFQLTSSRRG